MECWESVYNFGFHHATKLASHISDSISITIQLSFWEAKNYLQTSLCPPCLSHDDHTEDLDCLPLPSSVWVAWIDTPAGNAAPHWCFLWPSSTARLIAENTLVPYVGSPHYFLQGIIYWVVWFFTATRLWYLWLMSLFHKIHLPSVFCFL